MEEEHGETTPPKVNYTIVISVKVDYETLTRIDNIALFEKKKRATLCRDILLEKIRVYERNPAFKRFLKQLEARKE